MSIEQQYKIMQANEQMKRVHTFVSSVGNALERISIYIDEDEVEDAKREIKELREALGRITDA